MSLISGIGQVSGTLAGFSDAARGIGRLSSDAGSLLSGDFSAIGASGDLGAWADRLRPASWRGVVFAVQESTIERGRQAAIHSYAFRDTVWVEDLGRGTRRYGFRGFIVGDDVYTRRDKMLAAAETAGPGTLVHPSLGSIQVSLIEFSAGERADLGRVVEFQFGFIEGGPQVYPSSVVSTKDQVASAAGGATAATSGDFVSNVTSAIAHGAQVVQGAVVTVQGFASLAGRLASDASIAFGAVTGLAGNLGRYANGGRQTPQPSGITVAQALSSATTARTALATAGTNAAALAAAPTSSGFTSSISSLTEAFRALSNDPATQIRMLSALVVFQPAVQPSAAPIGAAIATATTSTGILCRQSALISIALACADYQPASSNDAQAVLGSVTTLFDTEILSAADAGDQQTYMALRSLRSAVVQDLNTRSAALPQIVTVTAKAPLPSLVLAYRLYQDATRADDLVTRANPIHPAFMPISFEALSR